MTTADQPKVTTFRIDADVLARLDAYAAQTRRSRNSAVNYLLQVGLDAEDARNLPERPDR
jgi:predicted transcriptional regulator